MTEETNFENAIILNLQGLMTLTLTQLLISLNISSLSDRFS